jgi:hypothetical protein
MEITYRQKCEDMDNQHHILEHGHCSSTVDIPEVHDKCDAPDHECTLPIGRLVRLLVNEDKRLDHSSDEEWSRSSTSLPAHDGHPASKVAEQLLVIRGSKLRDPICVDVVSNCMQFAEQGLVLTILSATGRCHTRHFSETQDYERHTSICPDITPEQTSNATSNETLSRGN